LFNHLKINVMSKKYVPTTRSGFRAWINSVYELVDNNAVLWGIPPALLAVFATMVAQFETLYIATENKTMRTGSQVIAFKVLRANLTKFMRDLVQVHLVRNTAIPLETKIAMNLNVRITGKVERVEIKSTPILGLSNGNRGMIKFTLMVPDMGKRAKIHPEANGAELRYFLSAPPAIVVPAAPEQTGGGTRAEGDAPTAATTPTLVPTPITRVGTVMATFITTRGSFERNFEAHIGKALNVQVRWINSTDESKNGTWSDLKVIIIA